MMSHATTPARTSDPPGKPAADRREFGAGNERALHDADGEGCIGELPQWLEYEYLNSAADTHPMGRRKFGCKWKMCLVIFAVVVYVGVFNLITHSRLSDQSTWDPGGEGYVYFPNGVPRGGRFTRLARVRGWSCKQLVLSETPLPLTALASFPGSGNTWVRHLIQQATGIATGSIYRDYALKLYGFPGEGIVNSSVIAVKTHESGPEAQAKFERCVLVIREPYGALLAEYNRRHAGHRGHATASNFGRAWREFVQSRARVWQTMNFDWLKFRGPLHVIRYEKLTSDLASEMRKLLTFLGVRVSQKDFACMLKNSEGLFHRTDGWSNKMDHFDKKMVYALDTIWTNMTEYLNSRFKDR